MNLTLPTLTTNAPASPEPAAHSITDHSRHPSAKPTPFAALLSAATAAPDTETEAETAPTTPLASPSPATQPADDSHSEDTPWPPEGLTSLWLPTPPAPTASSTPEAPVSGLPAAADAPAPITPAAQPIDPDPVLGTQHPDNPETSPPSQPEHPAQATGEHTLTPPDAESSPAPESLSHLWERDSGEGAAATAPTLHSETATGTPPAPPFSPIPTASANIPQSTTAAPPTSTAPYPAPDLHADNFPDTLGSHIHWLAEQKIGHAHIHLNPQDLGPVEVRLKLDGDQLHADFQSTHPDVRHALEQHLPRLRDLLSDHGLNLAQADIGQQHSQQHPSASTSTGAEFSTAPDSHEDDAPSAASTPAPAVSPRLLSTYA